MVNDDDDRLEDLLSNLNLALFLSETYSYSSHSIFIILISVKDGI